MRLNPCRCRAQRDVAEPGDIILTAAGSSSARLECTVRDREVASSNLAFPTISQQLNSNHPSAKSSDPTLTQPRLGPPARGARSDIHFPRRGNRADVGGGRSGMVIGRRVASVAAGLRSEEHTSELQSRGHLVCRLLLEKKKKK